MTIYVIRNKKAPTTFLYFNIYELFTFKTSDLLWTGRTLTCCLCSHTDPFAFSSVLSRLSRSLNLFLCKVTRKNRDFQYVIVDPEISWCNSEKFYGQGTEHGLMREYPVNDGRHQLVFNKIISHSWLNCRLPFAITSFVMIDAAPTQSLAD